MWDPFASYHLPLGDGVQSGLDVLVKDYRPFFHAIRVPVGTVLDTVETALIGTNPIVFLVLLFLFCWQFASLRSAVFATAAMTVIGVLGLWDRVDDDDRPGLGLGAVRGGHWFPLGVIAAKSDKFEAAVTPVLDVMQTLPGLCLHGPCRDAGRYRERSGCHRDCRIFPTANHSIDKPRAARGPRRDLEAARAFGATESRILSVFRSHSPRTRSWRASIRPL